jgi:Glucose-regulated metallo-peptidase M90
MLSRIIAAPFILLTFIFGYMGIEVDTDWVIYVVPCVVALAIIYVLSPQIDFWWAKRNPPDMPPKLTMFMEKQHPFYSKLSQVEQRRFRERVMLYMMANEFMPQKMEEVPKDIQTLIASNVVQLTFGQNDFLLNAFEHIIVYPRPFPSPQYPANFHTSEIYPPDKVMIFAIEQLIPGTINPTKHYNIGLHEYIRAYLHMYPNNTFPELPESTWQSLEQISGWSKAHIFKYINRPDVHILPVSISHFFVFGKTFKSVLPELYELYKNAFNMDTAREEDPVVYNE